MMNHRISWMRAGALAAAVFVAATGLYAPASADVAVTVYNRDLGLIRETRTIKLEGAEPVYSYEDVAARIDPTSVHLRAADGKALTVLEQNFEFDLLSSDKLYQRYLESRVDLFLEEGELITGTLLSTSGSDFILRGEDGSSVSVVSKDHVARVDLKGSIDGFYTRPTLVWHLKGAGGSRNVELEYLTGGMSWHAEYVALVNEKNDGIDLAGWVSVENRSGADYKDARLKLMAGDIHRAGRDVMQAMPRGMDMAMAKESSVEEREIFEYHLYEIKRPTTLQDSQVKQVSFVPNTKVPVVKEFVYYGQRGGSKVSVELIFDNSEKSGLGIALPAGVVRVFQDDGRGGSEFVGEDRIDHTPRNEEVRVSVGNAFDVVAERKVLANRRISDRANEQQIEIELRNRKDTEVTVRVVERLSGDWTVLSETHPHRREDAYTAEWKIAVPADGEVKLQYTARWKW